MKMKKFITILMLGFLMGCATARIAEHKHLAPEKPTIHKLVAAYYIGDPTKWKDPERKDCIFTTEIPKGTEVAVVWCRISCKKGTKITATWFYEGGNAGGVSFTAKTHLYVTDCWFPYRHEPLPPGEWRVVINADGREDSVKFTVH